MAEPLRPVDQSADLTQSPSIRQACQVVAALIAVGVRDIVTCPGSRNAPLLYAAGAAREAGLVRLHTRSDERSAAFVALGLSLGSVHSPVAVITTSGTAVANLHPAMLEAAHAGVPLIAVTADRTGPQRAAGANQAVRQDGIFGPDLTTVFVPVGGDVRVAASVLADTLSGPDARGVSPAHLNVEFGEPLVPAASRDGDPIAPLAALVQSALAEFTDLTGPATTSSVHAYAGAAGADGKLVGNAPPPAQGHAVAALAPDVTAVDHTIVIAGSGADPWVSSLCAAQGWPVIAEVVAGVAAGPLRIAHYRQLLDGAFAGTDAPARELLAAIDQVVVFGRPTLSRQVSRLLAEAPGRVITVGQHPGGVTRHFDPALRAAARFDTMPADWLIPGDVGGARAAWADSWTSAAAAIASRPASSGARDGDVARAATQAVLAATKPGDAVVLGPSRVIRVADECDVAPGATVFSNRGVSGIDGVVSTALGVALAREGGAVRAVMGDLTFLHDMGGLQVGRLGLQPDLQIVVINDGGGTIFSALEHGELARRGEAAAGLVEELLTTPGSANIELLCQSMGIRYATDLAQELAEPGPGITVIEVVAHPTFS